MSSIYTKHQPYVYLIRSIITKQFYCGSRYAKGCHPNDFWVKYFTSSKKVKALIEEHGTESFQVVNIYPVAEVHQARALEHQILKDLNASRNPLWLNQSNGLSVDNSGRKQTAAHTAKLGAIRKGKPNPKPEGWVSPLKGIPRSEEVKLKIRTAEQGKHVSDETRAKLSTANKGKPWSEARRAAYEKQTST